MSKYEDIKQIFEERVKKETFTMLCYEENSKSSMIISSKENFNYDDVCKDLKTSDTLFIFEKNIDFIEFKEEFRPFALDFRKNNFGLSERI